MAHAKLHAAAHPAKPGPIANGLLGWRPHGIDGETPFGGTSGPDAASGVLLRAYALTQCLAVAFADEDKGDHNDFGNLKGTCKSLALEGIGNLILLAKALVDDD